MPPTFYQPASSTHSYFLWHQHSFSLVSRLQVLLFFDSTSNILNWLLLAHWHYMWKTYFSDFYLTYMELWHPPSQSCCKCLPWPWDLLLPYSLRSKLGDQAGQADRDLVQSALWATAWGCFFITPPKPSLHIHLIHLFLPAALPLSAWDNLTMKYSLEINKG